MQDFAQIPLGESGQPELRFVARAAAAASDFFGAGDALACLVGPDDLPQLAAGAARTGLLGRIADLVDGDLADLAPPDPERHDASPERSRRTYVYPWNGHRRRLAAVALGEGAGAAHLRVEGDRLARALNKTGQRLGIVLGGRWASDPASLAALAEGLTYGNFSWRKFKTREPRRGLEEVAVLTDGEPSAATHEALARGAALARAAVLARGLTLEPPERLDPPRLAARALEIAAPLETVRCESWSEERIRAERLAGLLAVGRGSAKPVAQIEYVYTPPGGASRTVVLVGKGVTYDCGGLQDKGVNMNHMHRDMAGAAAVVAMMVALDRLRPPVRVVGLAGAAENMDGPNAYKTDEVIVHRDGKTTSVGHTDAEGRLVLYDQLVYARETHDPELIIDMATLTGAVKLALGTDTYGVMSNEKGRAARERLLVAARRAGEKAWPLPLDHDLPNSEHVIADYEKSYSKSMAGAYTDLDNNGKRDYGAGTCRGGAFLEEAIAGRAAWLHLDIAYTGMDGPTGSPVPTLCHLLLDES
ncbi:MAG: leucyl aminopeptidase [Candidatus Eiseniibacteriota bacterium]|jgi:leucyl aminopeptidase